MTRNAIRTVLATVALSMAAAPMMLGCKASASMNAGGGDPKPPPPPPPPATTTAPATPPPPPAAAPKPIKPPDGGGVAGDKVTLPGAIVFVTGKADIKPESEATLNVLKKFMDDNPQITLFRIEGHTDSDGDDAMNLKLSGNRALASVTWLANHGVARDRLIAVGFGKTKPIADNATAAGKEQNRRTEFHIAAIDGKAFLGRPGDGGGTVFKLGLAGHPAVRTEGPPRSSAGPLFFGFPGGSRVEIPFPRGRRRHARSRRRVRLLRTDAGPGGHARAVGCPSAPAARDVGRRARST
jgi:OOP family OmpA-OmpF porin